MLCMLLTMHASDVRSETDTKRLLVGRWCSDSNGGSMTIYDGGIVYHSDDGKDFATGCTYSRKSCDSTYLREGSSIEAEFLSTGEGLCYEIIGISDSILSLQYTENAKRHLYYRCTECLTQIDTGIVGGKSLDDVSDWASRPHIPGRDKSSRLDTSNADRSVHVDMHSSSRDDIDRFDRFVLTGRSGVRPTKSTTGFFTTTGCYIGMSENEFLQLIDARCLVRRGPIATDYGHITTYISVRGDLDPYVLAHDRLGYKAEYTFTDGFMTKIEFRFTRP